jgi:hypothetical protein
MIGLEQLVTMGPGDKLSLAFTKNPKPTWLQGQQEAEASPASAPAAPPAPMPMPMPMPMESPMAPPSGGLPPSPMALELMKRMGQ